MNLAIIGESQAQLCNTTLREWLRRAGLICHSGWGHEVIPEDVWFGTLTDTLPAGVPVMALGQQVTQALTGYLLPILKVRGSLLPMTGGGWVTATLNPNDFTPGKQDELKPLLGADARRAIEILAPRIPRVSFLQSPVELSACPDSGSIVSVDIEGANGKPNIVGVSWEEEVAYVFPWSYAMRVWLSFLFNSGVIPCFHNASFDVAELQEAGVTPPTAWYDTINMAALYDPDQPMNLQTQVLTHVPGSIAWKGLINHEKGPDYAGGTVSLWRELWKKTLRLVHQGHPNDGQGWYARYNALDTAWGLALARNLKRKLEGQGRWRYYTEVMIPLQAPLLAIGNRGMPVDEDRVASHKQKCLVKVAEATSLLVAAGHAMIVAKSRQLELSAEILTQAREAERAAGSRKFSKAKELSSLRTKLKAAVEFNPDSAQQRTALLYEWYGLPPIKNKGAKGFTSDDTAIEDLISRLERGTIKPKRGKTAEVLPVLQAMIDVKKWGTLERTFLNPELR